MSAACWADPLSRRERFILAGMLSRACGLLWTNGDNTTSTEMADLRIDATERAEVAAS